MGSFRHDINGLRALAVVSVLLFHFNAPGFGGGFVGVDVFFVISGYLMTRIVLGGLNAGRFSIWAFYGDRVRRIVPALLVLLSALLVGGLIVVDPLGYRSLAIEALTSVLFVSNLLYATQQGYFAPDAQGSWLLHTWSLSVEWQFYLVYPLLLMALHAWTATRRWMNPIIVAVALLSFAAAAFLTSGGGTAGKYAFYMLPTRAWEMLLGAIVAVYAVRLRPAATSARFLEIVGLALIAASILIFNNQTLWPSVFTAVPVAGAALVIWAGRAEAGWARLPGVGAIGRWSYSIYLWHWPLLVLVGPQTLHKPWAAPVLTVISIALGAASYGLAERRFRAAVFEGGTRRARAAVATFIAIAVFAALGLATNGFETLRISGLPVSVQADLRDYRQAAGDWRFEKTCLHPLSSEDRPVGCLVGGGPAPQVLVIGDSLAEQLAPRYANRDDVTVAFATNPGCPPIPDMSAALAAFPCQSTTQAAFRHAASGAYRRVVVVGSWQYYFTDGSSASPCFGSADNCVRPQTDDDRRKARAAAIERLMAELAALKASGVEPVVLLPLPWLATDSPRQRYVSAFSTKTSRRLPYALSDYEARVGPIHQELRAAAAKVGVQVVDPAYFLCPDGQCPVEIDGRYVFARPGHYRASLMTNPRFAFLDAYLAPSAAEPSDPQGLLLKTR